MLCILYNVHTCDQGQPCHFVSCPQQSVGWFYAYGRPMYIVQCTCMWPGSGPATGESFSSLCTILLTVATYSFVMTCLHHKIHHREGLCVDTLKGRYKNVLLHYSYKFIYTHTHTYTHTPTHTYSYDVNMSLISICLLWLDLKPTLINHYDRS